jgi:hypothetical protein
MLWGYLQKWLKFEGVSEIVPFFFNQILVSLLLNFLIHKWILRIFSSKSHYFIWHILIIGFPSNHLVLDLEICEFWVEEL